MYKLCGLRIGPNIGVGPVIDKKFYLRLAADKRHSFAVSAAKYLRPCGCSGTNFTAMVNCTNPYTEIQNEITDIEIIETQT